MKESVFGANFQKVTLSLLKIILTMVANNQFEENLAQYVLGYMQQLL